MVGVRIFRSIRINGGIMRRIHFLFSCRMTGAVALILLALLLTLAAACGSDSPDGGGDSNPRARRPPPNPRHCRYVPTATLPTPAAGRTRRTSEEPDPAPTLNTQPAGRSSEIQRRRLRAASHAPAGWTTPARGAMPQRNRNRRISRNLNSASSPRYLKTKSSARMANLHLRGEEPTAQSPCWGLSESEFGGQATPPEGEFASVSAEVHYTLRGEDGQHSRLLGC